MEVIQAEKLAEEREQVARDYAKHRYKASKAYIELMTYVIAELPELKKKRRSIGKEMAILETCAINEQAKKAHDEWELHTSQYKALERVIDAKSDRVGLARSIWKAERSV